MKVLIITYYWPPSGGSGVQRWMYFAKYLSQFDIEPIVLTVDEEKASYKHIDTSFNEQVAHVKTYRTNSFEPLQLYSKISSGTKQDGLPQGSVKSKGVFNKVANYIRSNYFIPDARMGWNRFALKKVRSLLSKENINWVITTGPPHSTHLIGLELKKQFNIKWMADFRDPWTDLFYLKDLMRTESSNRKDAALERLVLEKADLVLTVGVKLKELLQSKLTGQQDKFHHIYNGFDHEKMSKLIKRPSQHFQLTIVGMLSENQPYQAMVKSIAQFAEQQDGSVIKFTIGGHTEPAILKYIESNLPNIEIDYQGYVSHKDALQLMMDADVLLNCTPVVGNSEIMITGKMMEYLATGNNILCIGNREGEIALLFENFEHAKVFEENEFESMVNFLSDSMEKKTQNSTISRSDTAVSMIKYSRKETCKELAALIHDYYQ